MRCEILVITAESAVSRITLSDLRAETIREAEAALTECTVWIVPLKARDEMAKLAGVVDDRGKKHPAIELARTLKGKGPEIPMIEGEYTSDGKLRQSVQKFLQKTSATPHRLFIIAVSDDLFATINSSAPEQVTSAPDAMPFSGKSGAVLRLMDFIPEPAALRKAFIGDSADAVAVRQFIMRAAQADDTVLIMGDTGTGKEIVAQQIHQNSLRRDRPFRAVNCGAFPRDLLESELFGHVRGAFTGALTSNEGLWVSADGGTLFLDEIGELTPAHQAKLLRVLQDNHIRKVGGSGDIRVNARVVCATNRDLFAMVQAGQFREDLYYRLRGFLITTPPLREHKEDIAPLARAFWAGITKDANAILPDDIVTALRAYAWPGNVRELKMVLTHLFGLFRTEHPLDARHLLAVFEMQGLHLPSKSREVTPEAEPRPGDLSSFHHLRRVYETIRAVEHLLAPLLSGKGPKARRLPYISTGIANLLNELDLHGRIPSHFSPHTFENISLLRSRLAYFISEHEKAPENAIAFLRSGTRALIDEAIAEILAEIDRTLAEAL